VVDAVRVCCAGEWVVVVGGRGLVVVCGVGGWL
jgi:hypothetical protein